MINKQAQLDQLSRLLKWKESKTFMAKKLNVSIEELNDLLKEVRQTKLNNLLEDKGVGSQYEVSGGWVKEKGLSLRFTQKKEAEKVSKEEFSKFLEGYVPEARQVANKHNNEMVGSCLVINKQDAHLNKYNVVGTNNINERFNDFYRNLTKILRKSVATSNLDKIIYVLGSDEFNSEHTGRTTHDTPQQNILDFHSSFEAICAHEISIIRLLQEFANNIYVIYVPGNHDEHVGWHMVNWLNAYYRNCNNVHFDSTPSYTKYVKYSNTAMCFNHGYVVKPEQLAQNFPIEFKEHWSTCDNFYIFTGDKHTELSRTIGGIKFYRIAQISKAKSKWDMERGYGPSKGEITAFLIEEGEGLTDIYHQSV